MQRHLKGITEMIALIPRIILPGLNNGVDSQKNLALSKVGNGS